VFGIEAAAVAGIAVELEIFVTVDMVVVDCIVVAAMVVVRTVEGFAVQIVVEVDPDMTGVDIAVGTG
jgi:hypothetical protein